MTDSPESSGPTAAPPFLTGGGGFDYEHRVAGYILAAMLAEQPPFGEETSHVVKVDWQTKVSGWRFDDLLVTCQGRVERHIAISCKAGRYVTAGRWPDEAVRDLWEQWVDDNSNPLDKSNDLMAVVTGSVALDAKEAWDRLVSDALVGDAQRFMAQYQTAGASSDTARSLVNSLKCPSKLMALVTDEPTERFNVIQHTRLWILDMLTTDSAAATRAIDWCRSVLASGDRAEALTLFQRLVALAAERASHSGTISNRDLIAILAGDFALQSAPSHEASWRKLTAHSTELIGDVRSTINNAVSFTHREAWAQLLKSVIPGGMVVLEGESGSGKSALAKRLAHGRRRVLWLSAADLEFATLDAVGSHLGAPLSLAVLLDEERGTDALLVVDGAERLASNGKRAAAKIITAAMSAAKPWRIVVTSQIGGSDALLQEVGKSATGDGAIQLVEVRLLDEETVQQAVAALGITLSANATPSLLRVLRNLKALDWVAGAATSATLASFPDLVEHIWKRLIGSGQARARGEVLKTLGKADAAALVGGVASSLFPGANEQHIIETLVRDGLLSERRQRLFFRHDLLGDWARLLTLIEAGDQVAPLLKEVATSIRWGPAIRLFAGWLLQQGAADRGRLVSLVLNDPPNPVSIALLEGLFRSPDCGPALTAILDNQAWCTPVALNALLSTFVSVATQPAEICWVISKADPASFSVRATFRTPVLELWPVVVGALEQHTERLAQHVPLRLGQTVRWWLSDASTVSRRDLTATHHACSKLAAAAARELQAQLAESRHLADDDTEAVFAAALYAAPWLPDEIAQLALELSARRPEPTVVKERVAAERKRVTQEISERLAKLKPEERERPRGSSIVGPTPRRRRPPLSQGPASRVNEQFRQAVFTPAALVRLMDVRPDAAHEVLLACCLEDAGAEDPLHAHHYHGDQAGTIEPMGWYPPLYLRGPWAKLLGSRPRQGLETVLRLVAVATSEWLRLHIPPAGHARHDSDVRLSTITLNIDGVARVFRGDHQVFAWYRGHGRAGNIVASALMALEHWLYSQIDAGKSIDWAVKVLWDSGSCACLGVLTSLARRNHELLEASLRPLIQSWMLLDWDEHLSGHALIPSMDPLGLRPFNTFYDDEAERWSALPHRKHRLPWLIAQKLAFKQPGMAEACEEARTIWSVELETGTCLSPESVQRFLALLDANNLRVEQLPDKELVLSVRWPAELQAKYDARGKGSQAAVLGFRLRKLLREFLDEPSSLTDDKAESVWKEAVSLPAPSQDDADTSDAVVGARAAVAAVLETQATAWLDKFPNRRAWCESAALAAIRRGRKSHPFSSGVSIFAEEEESFAAEWAIARLAAGDDRELVRRVFAQAISGSEPIVTGQGLAAAIRLAKRFPGELGRVFNLVWLWAVLHNLSRVMWEPDSEEVEARAEHWRQRLIGAFVRRRIPVAPMDWDDFKLRAARATERQRRRRRAQHSARSVKEDASDIVAPSPLPAEWDQFGNHGFSQLVLAKVAVHPVPYVVRPSLGPELEPLAEHDRRLIDLTVWTLKRERRIERHSGEAHPDMLDRQVLSRAASIIARHEDESTALNIWKSLAAYLAHHRYWVEVFFGSWFSCDRKEPENAKQFHRRWQLMIEHTEGLSEWQAPADKRWYDFQQAKSALLGVHEQGSRLGEEYDRPFLAKMVARYAQWAQVYATDASRLRSLCHFLQKVGASDLRLPALSWVRDALKALSAYRASDQRLIAEIVALCVTVWHRQQDALLGNTTARSALIDIIQHLAAQHVQEIKELQADIESVIAQAPSENRQ